MKRAEGGSQILKGSLLYIFIPAWQKTPFW